MLQFIYFVINLVMFTSKKLKSKNKNNKKKIRFLLNLIKKAWFSSRAFLMWNHKIINYMLGYNVKVMNT